MSHSSRHDLECYEAKVVILGSTAVGKTSMLNQFIRGHFPLNTQATVGAAFLKKSVKIGEHTIILQIWDTAGQERFRSMAPMYFRGAQAVGAILVYDVTQPSSFAKIHSWVEELQSYTSSSDISSASDLSANIAQAADSGSGEKENLLLVLAANKTDLLVDRTSEVVDREMAVKYAETIDATYIETSAKTGTGIEVLFFDIAKRLLERHLAKVRISQQTAGGGGKELRYQSRGGMPQQQAKQQTQEGGCC